jgi:RHS repeat-associated protein
LYETRSAVDSTQDIEVDGSGIGSHFGVVAYTYGMGLDVPLDLFKGSTVVLPYTNWRGQIDKGTCPSTECVPTSVEFPGSLMSSYGDPFPDGNPDGPPSWYGSLITGMQDGSGYQYRRNRYYDPKAGRFTQEDPIGLAGGLNAYGFANGDPVSYSDPFGLFPGADWGRTIALTYALVGNMLAQNPQAFDRLSEPVKEIVHTMEHIEAEQMQTSHDIVEGLEAGARESERLIETGGAKVARALASPAMRATAEDAAETLVNVGGKVISVGGAVVTGIVGIALNPTRMGDPEATVAWKERQRYVVSKGKESELQQVPAKVQ